MELTLLTENEVLKVQAQPGQDLLQVIRGEVEISAPCGGKGTCGKCMVYLVTDRGETEVKACCTPAEAGMQVRVPAAAPLSVMRAAAAEHPAPVDAGITGYGIACDIGTTTVVCHLLDLTTGQRLATVGEGNAQRAYGGDVISRIRASMDGALPALQSAITGQLSRMTMALCSAAGIAPEGLQRMTIAGNTTMCHLVTGLSPDSIGSAPFTPMSLFGDVHQAQAMNLPFAGEVYILPAVSGYVGGDITADLLAAEMDRLERPALLIDVGTNGEMALGCGKQFLCCSTAAGPAFEGAQIHCGMTAAAGAISEVFWSADGPVCKVIGDVEARGICGSGLIDAAAMLLELGVVDETGRMLDIEEDEDEIPEKLAPYLFLLEDSPAFRLTQKVFITQADIRKLQLGKAAIAAGAAILRRRYVAVYGAQPSQLLLAGGFGSYIRPESAARIGLIPADLLPVTRALGNTASRGAELALASESARIRLGALQQNMEYLELSGLQEFNDHYIEEMMFPEAKDD